MATKMYKCAYSHCRHESLYVSKDEAIKVGNRYMHKDCAEIREKIDEVYKLYFDQVSDTVVEKNLRATINNIVFNKNVDPEFLLFALKYAIRSKFRITSPYSLHYIIDNSRIKENWNVLKETEIRKQITETKERDELNPTGQSFVSQKKTHSGFGSIFGGN